MDEKMKAQFIRELSRALDREEHGQTEARRAMGRGASSALERVLLAAGYEPVYTDGFTRCIGIVAVEGE